MNVSGFFNPFGYVLTYVGPLIYLVLIIILLLIYYSATRSLEVSLILSFLTVTVIGYAIFAEYTYINTILTIVLLLLGAYYLYKVIIGKTK